MASRRSGSGIDANAGSSSSVLSSNQISFCVNPVLFENCGLLLDAPSGLTTASVMKLRQETANATAISLATWKDLAVSVLGLREVTAYSIFDVFFALSGGCIQGSPSFYYGSGEGALGGRTVAEFRQESNRVLLSKMGGSVDEERWPVASTARHVSLPGLIIFLLTQLLLERPPRFPLGEITPETVAENVRQYLHDYITAVAVTRPGRVTIADALELRVLLREFVNGVEQPLGTSLGVLWPRSEKTVDIAILSQFIRPRITLPADLASDGNGRRSVSTATGGGAASRKAFANNVTTRGVQGTIVMPPAPPVNDSQTVRLMSSNFAITECEQTAVYVPAALPHTRLAQLSNCTIALGPIGGVLCIDRCRNCTISALCGAIVVSQCVNVQIFVCTNTPPVLLFPRNGGSISNNGDAGAAALLKNVRFAPYNSHYSALEDDLTLSGVNPKLNLWNAGLPSQNFILPPEEFTPISFPVNPPITSAMTTRTNPCTLPQPYQEALSRRLQRFEDISNDLRDACTRLEEDGRKDLADGLRGSVHAMFFKWLEENGQAAGLQELLNSTAPTNFSTTAGR